MKWRAYVAKGLPSDVAYQPNPGRIPSSCVVKADDGSVKYRAVHVRLFGGHDTKAAGLPPWPAGDGRLPTDWRISDPPHKFQIMEWEVA